MVEPPKWVPVGSCSFMVLHTERTLKQRVF